MSWFSDLLGTTKSFFRIGLSGPRLKASGSDVVVRNAGDTADANATAAKVSISGDVLDINSDAAATGADWKYTLQRPTTGMTAAVVLTLPIDDGSPAQGLVTDGAGVLSFATIGGSADKGTVDTTSLAFGSTSPVTMFTTPANAVIEKVQVVIDTAFNGTPSLSVGISGTVSKYLSATDLDLTMAAGTVFEVHPGLPATAGEALIATYAAGGATAGAARILVFYSVPS